MACLAAGVTLLAAGYICARGGLQINGLLIRIHCFLFLAGAVVGLSQVRPHNRMVLHILRLDSLLRQLQFRDGQEQEAVDAYQKAIDLQPTAGTYGSQSTALAILAVAQTDPAVAQQKLAEAGTDCDKAAALDPTPGAAKACWKNIGIVLSNKGDLKDAIPPLQKATLADPKDAQTWFLLGSAYTGTIDSKQEGDKMTYIIPPGTSDAYQKCVDADPNGPYAAQCKAMIDTLTTMAGGDSTSVNVRKKKKS